MEKSFKNSTNDNYSPNSSSNTYIINNNNNLNKRVASRNNLQYTAEV